MIDERPVRVLFLTRYPIAGASSRYRVFQYIPYLQEVGIHCEVQSFMNDELYKCSFVPGRTSRKLYRTMSAVLKRLWVLRRFRQFDVIYMQRELFPFGPPWTERLLKRLGARLIFDYDDALFISKASRYNALASLLRSPGKTLQLFGFVDVVIAGNNWLRDQAAEHGAHAVTLEVAEEVERFGHRAPFKESDSVVIGWLGSTSTAKYLELIKPVLQDLARRHPSLRFELMGAGAFFMDGVPWRGLEWSLAGEVAALRRWDIGLMPLPNEDWAKGKSGGKARTYMAAGVVPICSAIGYNLELIDHGRTGILCSTEDDWRTSLEQLVQEPSTRASISYSAREEVRVRFSPRLIAYEMAKLLKEVAAGSRPRRGRA